jgi:uncharacterized protein with von Willebrand factor type A (vWA) domain
LCRDDLLGWNVAAFGNCLAKRDRTSGCAIAELQIADILETRQTQEFADRQVLRRALRQVERPIHVEK